MQEPERRRLFDAALSDEAYRSAWSYACRLCTAGGVVQRADAEDLLQEALLRAYQRFHQLRDAARFKGWLLAIMRSSHIDRLRRKGRLVEALENDMGLVMPQPDNALAEIVMVALLQLPPAQRELISLFYLEGLSLEETGQVLGMKPRIVRQRLYRAREALRKRTAPLWDPQPQSVIAPQVKEGLWP